LGAERGIGASDRAGDADLDLGLGGAAEQQHAGQRQAREKGSFHFNLLIRY
jgi:hypothetical protein